MSDEDRAFLEAVMKDGIIDENQRMKVILKEVTEQMEVWRTEPPVQEQEDHIEGLLQELRDIVEQIDYARAFAAMKGLNFLLGGVQESQLPRSTRIACLGVLATMAQHNPSVQKQLLEIGSLRVLSDLFFREENDDRDGQLRGRIMQAISANVRSYDMAESLFFQLEQAVPLVEQGLGVEASTPPPVTVRQRTLFFLRALVTSDSATQQNVRLFSSCIGFVADRLVDDGYEESTQLREMSLALLEQVMEQRKSVNTILDRKNGLVALGVRRVAALRQLTHEEREMAEVELEHWERLLVLLARTARDVEAPAVPLLEADQNQTRTPPQ